MTAPERSPLARGTAPCRQCAATVSTWDLALGLRCATCTDAALRRIAPAPAPAPAPEPDDLRPFPVGFVLSYCAFLALAVIEPRLFIAGIAVWVVWAIASVVACEHQERMTRVRKAQR